MRRARSGLLLLESDPWRRDSLVAFLAAEGFDVATEEGGGSEPEFVLVDLADENGTPTARIERIRARHPEARVVAFVREVNARTTFPCLMAGVKGILPHSAGSGELRNAIRCIREGSLWIRDGWPGLNVLTSGEAVLPDAAVEIFPFSAGQANFGARVQVAPA